MHVHNFQRNMHTQRIFFSFLFLACRIFSYASLGSFGGCKCKVPCVWMRLHVYKHADADFLLRPCSPLLTLPDISYFWFYKLNRWGQHNSRCTLFHFKKISWCCLPYFWPNNFARQDKNSCVRQEHVWVCVYGWTAAASNLSITTLRLRPMKLVSTFTQTELSYFEYITQTELNRIDRARITLEGSFFLLHTTTERHITNSNQTLVGVGFPNHSGKWWWGPHQQQFETGCVVV
jgi:hypothetical protein